MRNLINYNPDQSTEDNLKCIEDAIAADLGNRELYEEAIEILSTMIKKDPDDHLLYRHRGHRYLSISCFDEAVEDLKFSLKIEPSYWKNWYYLGMISFFKGDYEAALTNFDRAMEIEGPESSHCGAIINWEFVTLSHLDQRNSEKANKIMSYIVPGKCNEKSAYVNMILMNKGLKNFDEVARLMEESDDIDYPTYGYGLAAYCYYTGDKDKSKKILNYLIDNAKGWYTLGYKACEAEKKRFFN